MTDGEAPGDDVYTRLENMSVEYAYSTFVDLRDRRIRQNEESYQKYKYALELRKEAAEHLGIENIRKARLRKLAQERVRIESDYENGRHIYPDFKLSLLIRLEA